MKYKIKTKLLAVAIIVSGLPFIAAMSATAAPAAPPSQALMQQCYIYNGHGYGPDTDNALTGALAAAYKASNCDKTKNGPCTSNPVTQGIRLTCTAPTGSGSTGTSADTAADCSQYGLTSSASNDACIYNPNSAAAADPALKGCTNSSADANNQDCDIVSKYVNPLIQVLSAAVGVAVAAAIAYGGILYSTSSGDAGKVTKAKDLIRNAVLALVAYIFFYSFIQWLIPGGIFH